MMLETPQEARRIHYRTRRRARDARGVRIRHVRVRPTIGVEHLIRSKWGTQPTRRADDGKTVYPEGHLLFYSPDRPTFRAIVAQDGRWNGGHSWRRMAHEVIACSSRTGRYSREWAGGHSHTMAVLPYALGRIQRVLVGA